ncbi:peptidase associated/transthyretin-like domain-containing protein [Flavitalea flava]
MLLFLFHQAVSGQIEIEGTVYDRTQRFALREVSVMGSSGKGTVTDSAGHYHIRLFSRDSISFSYLGRATAKIPVKDLAPGFPLDMSIQVAIDSLPTAYVRPHSYRSDSLQNREEYQKIFDYGANYLQETKAGRSGGVGVGIDFDMLLNPRRNRRMLAFQQRLIDEEQDKYVDYRFKKTLVRKITGLQSPALDSFMRLYRPSYARVRSFETDYEFYEYIRDWGQVFSEAWRRDHGK